MGSRHAGKPEIVKRTYTRIPLGRDDGPPLINEMIAEDTDGNVVEYSLAYIDFAMYAGDNGRVLGYDNAHGFHERHFMGSSCEIHFGTYEHLREELQLK